MKNIGIEVADNMNLSHQVSFSISPQDQYPHILMTVLHKVLQLQKLTETLKKQNIFSLMYLDSLWIQILRPNQT